MRLSLSLVILLNFIFINLFADSPLTSTNIKLAYQNLEIVKKTSLTNGILTNELAEFLWNPNNSIDVKIAVINELGWEKRNRKNSQSFLNFLKHKNYIENEADLLELASAEILICYAYLNALENYQNVTEAVIFAQKARSKNSLSYSISLISTLIEAQEVMNTDWCSVYSYFINLKNPSLFKFDIKVEAVEIIFNYINKYREFCL
jgi:hypothetical protein